MRYKSFQFKVDTMREKRENQLSKRPAFMNRNFIRLYSAHNAEKIGSYNKTTELVQNHDACFF